MRIHVSSLGCKLNQNEMETLGARLAQDGHQVVATPETARMGAKAGQSAESSITFGIDRICRLASTPLLAGGATLSRNSGSRFTGIPPGTE